MTMDILNGDHAEFEVKHANTPPRERPDWPLPKLRRCPCCGGEGFWAHRRTENFLPCTVTVSELWRVRCFNCNLCTQWSDSSSFIASEWNRVPAPADSPALPAPKAKRRAA